MLALTTSANTFSKKRARTALRQHRLSTIEVTITSMSDEHTSLPGKLALSPMSCAISVHVADMSGVFAVQG
jgi:hypothetical protein